MVNLEGYKETKFIGKIVAMREEPLRTFLGDKVEKFKDGMTRFPKSIKTTRDKEQYKNDRLDKNVIVLCYEVKVNEQVMQNEEFFTIPSPTGWNKSRLKALYEKNDLGTDTEKWLGKEVKVNMNKDGYLRLLE